MELVRQRRMSGHVERRHADVGGCKNRRNLRMWQSTNQCNPVHPGSGLTHTFQFGAVADKHGLDVAVPLRAYAAYRINEEHSSVPGTKGPCEYREDVAAGT